MERYIIGYTFKNHVLRLRSRVTVKLNFRLYIRQYISRNENVEYSYPQIYFSSTWLMVLAIITRRWDINFSEVDLNFIFFCIIYDRYTKFYLYFYLTLHLIQCLCRSSKGSDWLVLIHIILTKTNIVLIVLKT